MKVKYNYIWTKMYVVVRKYLYQFFVFPSNKMNQSPFHSQTDIRKVSNPDAPMNDGVSEDVIIPTKGGGNQVRETKSRDSMHEKWDTQSKLSNESASITKPNKFIKTDKIISKSNMDRTSLSRNPSNTEVDLDTKESEIMRKSSFLELIQHSSGMEVENNMNVNLKAVKSHTGVNDNRRHQSTFADFRSNALNMKVTGQMQLAPSGDNVRDNFPEVGDAYRPSQSRYLKRKDSAKSCSESRSETDMHTKHAKEDYSESLGLSPRDIKVSKVVAKNNTYTIKMQAINPNMDTSMESPRHESRHGKVR